MTTWTSRNIAVATTIFFLINLFLFVFWHQRVSSLCCIFLGLSWSLFEAGEISVHQEAGRGSGISEDYVAWRFNYYFFGMSDGCVPEYSFLCRVRWRADLLGPVALSAAREDRCTLLLALILLLVPVLYTVWIGRSLQVFLQVWMLSGAYFPAQGAFPLYLIKHSGVSTYPWHLKHLKERVNILNLLKVNWS